MKNRENMFVFIVQMDLLYYHQSFWFYSFLNKGLLSTNK